MDETNSEKVVQGSLFCVTAEISSSGNVVSNTAQLQDNTLTKSCEFAGANVHLWVSFKVLLKCS